MPPNKEQLDWQGIWDRLRKLGIELDENRRNGIMEAFKRRCDSFPIGWRPLLKRYTEDDGRVHVHIRHRMLSSPYLLGSPNLCATFEWPRGVFLEDSELRFWADVSDRYDIMESNEKEREVKVAMLVDVLEFLENRERLFGCILPVVKRCAKVYALEVVFSETGEV